MKAKDIMITDVPTISKKATLKEAIQLLRKNYGDKSFINAAPGLVVVNDWGELAGVLMPLGIIKTLLESSGTADPAEREKSEFYEKLCDNCKDMMVADVMEREPISVTEDARIADILDLFISHHFHRIPVVREKKVVGIVYRTPLLFAMTNCFFK
jgi:CBS domain-containing protein